MPALRRMLSSSITSSSSSSSCFLSLSSALVACNVYVSAGGAWPGQIALLQDLLRRAQERCCRFQCRNEGNLLASSPAPSPSLPVAVVVHAYVDAVYNRSSFHLAGSAGEVATMAGELAVEAIDRLQRQQREQQNNDRPKNDDEIIHLKEFERSNVDHPFVGLVDHVAVMPIGVTRAGNDSSESSSPAETLANREDWIRSADDENDKTNSSGIRGSGRGGEEDDEEPPATEITASGWCARRIGRTMSSAVPQLRVHYYGTAHAENVPLATVRRQRTDFFRSGGLSSPSRNGGEGSGGERRQQQQEVATIGAPERFAENYNLRLASGCGLRRARALARRLRERDGGLRGVEAITLPYSRGRHEVACNLLEPEVGTVVDLQAAAEDWEKGEQQKTNDGKCQMPLLEIGYRVGTTEEQCLEALARCQASTEERRRHDEEVRKRFRGYFSF